MKIRIVGTGNKGKDSYISRTFDLADPFWMNIAVKCWKENASKFDSLDIIDAETGEDPVGDPFGQKSDFYAWIEKFSNKVAGIKK